MYIDVMPDALRTGGFQGLRTELARALHLLPLQLHLASPGCGNVGPEP